MAEGDPGEDTSTTDNALPPLFPPQEVAIKRGTYLRRCPIIGTMGSGKTRVGLGIYENVVVGWRDATEPAAILCRTNAFPTWVRQLGVWLDVPPELVAIIRGTPKYRRDLWQRRREFRFVLTTYSSFLNDAERWIPRDLNMFMDEYHNVARTRTKTYKLLKSWTLHSECVLPLTGTPARRGPQDMFPVLSLCNPRFFTSYWKFVKQWCVVIKTDFGQEIVGPKNMVNFREEIYAGYCAYMPKKETDKYLPQKHRVFIPIECSAFQRKLIDDIEKQMYIELGEQIQLIPSRMTQILRERQVLVTPKLLNPDWEYGTGIETLGDLLEDLDTPRPVVFTDFADAVPIIAEFLRKKFKGRNVYELRGGMKVEDLMERVDSFVNSADDVVVCSQQYAESFEFPTSQTGFVLGFNWSKDVNEQAEDRLRRAISKYSSIKFFYLQYLDTVDGDVLDTVRRKARNVRLITPTEIIRRRRSR